MFHGEVRIPSKYDGDRMSLSGDAVVWHAVNTALYFLVTMININKKRTLEGRPSSEKRFDPDMKTDTNTVFRYSEEWIQEGVLGVCLHAIGLSYKAVHALLPSTDLSPERANDRRKIQLLKRCLYTAKHLTDRQDISSIARMLISLQYNYPDGTGYPPPFENKFLHEFARLMHIIDFYDEMTQATVWRTVYSRMDVINYIKQHSGIYSYKTDGEDLNSRFDSTLLKEFLNILAPWDIGEKVYLYPDRTRNCHMFVGRVHSYMDSHIPVISILKNEKTGKEYRDGEVLFYIPQSLTLLAKDGKIVKKTKLDWIGRLELFDLNCNAGNIWEYTDVLFGKERPLPRPRIAGR